MKWFAFLLCSFSCWAGLADVKSVYLLPMRNGLDQYLANRLTNAGVLKVVTDPSKADAVFTDRLGTEFEERFDELFTPPEPPAPPEEKAAKGEEADKKADEDKDKPARAAEQDSGSGSSPLAVSSRSRGTVFLVEVKTNTVLWSTFKQPKDSMAVHIDRTAAHIVKALQKSLAPQAKKH
jgi:hypothetical protein